MKDELIRLKDKFRKRSNSCASCNSVISSKSAPVMRNNKKQQFDQDEDDNDPANIEEIDEPRSLSELQREHMERTADFRIKGELDPI